MPLSIYAAGLGKLNVNSGLGEPLKAEIELLSVTPEELSTLAATIASEEAYAAQGITRLGVHNNIKVEIAKKADGSPILKLRSTQPISDPYLDMLVQVDWATGRLQREYTVLLDPPGYNPQTDSNSVAPVNLPSAISSENVEPTTSNVPSNSSANAATTTSGSTPSAKKTKKVKKAVAKQPVQDDVDAMMPAASNQAADSQEQTTQRGDTLSSLAKEMQVEGVSLDQMLVGLYENNQEAFVGGNMNRLKVGQIIKVPTKESLTSIGTQEAKKSIKMHSVNWNAYRNSLAGTVAAAPAMADVEEKQSTSGKIATAEDKAAPVKAGAQDVVKLSAGEKDAGKGASKAFDAKMTALQEEATAREKSLKEAQDRTAALEKQIADTQKLLALKSQSMTDMQKNAEAAAKAAEVKPVVVATVEAPKVEVTPPAEVKPVEVTPVAKPAPQTAVKPTVVVEPAAAEPGMLEGLMNSADLAVIGGATGVALLGAGWMFLRNKRRKDLDSFERGILTSGGLRANTVFGNTTGNASVSDTSFLTDFAQSADGSMIDTNDVDPIAEAEVYMAYGRDAQAEEILKDAISKEPKRYELHLKLLEMYASRKDNSAFEAIAGELYTTLGAEDPTWAKVAVLGAELEPGNPLYDASKSVGSSVEVAKKLVMTEFSDGLSETNVSAPNGLDDGLDFSLDGDVVSSAPALAEESNDAITQNFTTAQSGEQEMSFDLGSVDDVNLTKVAENSMDFDLGDFGEVEAESVQADEIKATEELPMLEIENTKVTDFDMDFSFPTDSVESGADAIAEVKSTVLASDTLDDLTFDMDFSEVIGEKAPAQSTTDASEINFDLPQSNHEAADIKAQEHTANTFDLSAINLDVNEVQHELSPVTPTISTVADNASVVGIDAESQDVNIKLDLVAAYIDMDDKEGARELLAEVLKEGGEHQQARAKQLLASLA